jgi:uncharacterized protein DUF2125
MSVHKRKILTAFLILAVFAFGGYTYLWFHTAEKLEDWLLETLARLEQRGYLSSYDRIEVKGFPFKLEVRLFDPCIQFPKPTPFKVSASGVMTATTCIWRPQYVTIKQDNKTSFVELIKEMEEIEFPLASLDHFQIRGLLNGSFFKDYAVLLKGVHIGAWSAEEISFDCLNEDKGDKLAKINLNIKDLSVKESINKFLEGPLVSTIQHFALEANLLMPKMREGSIETILKAWYEQDGTVDVKKFAVIWNDIQVEGNGSLSLDQDLQPLATFGVKIYGIDPFLKKLVQLKLIRKGSLLFVKAILSPLARTNELNKQVPYYQFSMSVQDRELSIEGIPITQFDAINWWTDEVVF